MYQVFAEPKIRRRATASSRGVVGRKPNPKMRGDEQVPRRQPTAKRKTSDIRCDAVGTSEHVIAKSSICNRTAFYKSGVYVSFRGEADKTDCEASRTKLHDLPQEICETDPGVCRRREPTGPFRRSQQKAY
ncbi:MAG: hypothetical protein AAGB46_18370 [Verrucomicrobiota bacterium]